MAEMQLETLDLRKDVQIRVFGLDGETGSKPFSLTVRS